MYLELSEFGTRGALIGVKTSSGLAEVDMVGIVVDTLSGRLTYS